MNHIREKKTTIYETLSLQSKTKQNKTTLSQNIFSDKSL
jgi:hypothetical protein